MLLQLSMSMSLLRFWSSLISLLGLMETWLLMPADLPVVRECDDA
jgi:hypothetical protein